MFQQDGPGFSYLAILESNAVGRYLYCPYGPVVEDHYALKPAFESLRQLAAEEHAHFIRLEPVTATTDAGVRTVDASLRRAGCVPAPRDIQPRRSWLVDLRADDDELLAQMKSTNRNLHRNIHKKAVSFTTSSDPADIGILLGFLHQTAAQSRFKPQDDDYLRAAAKSLMPGGHATLYVAHLHDAPIGAALVYDSADTRTYAHAALDSTYRKLSAGIPMVVRMILDAKAKGLTTFDMWGVAPDDEPDHPWAGFSYFKKSFGGAAIEYPGTWDLPVNRAAYGAYTLARKTYQQVKKVRSR